MILQVALSEAQQRLPELVKRLTTGDEVIITDQDRPVARLVGQRIGLRQDRRPGSAKGRLRIIAEDDEHLADFADYMP